MLCRTSYRLLPERCLKSWPYDAKMQARRYASELLVQQALHDQMSACGRLLFAGQTQALNPVLLRHFDPFAAGFMPERRQITQQCGCAEVPAHFNERTMDRDRCVEHRQQEFLLGRIHARRVVIGCPWQQVAKRVKAHVPGHDCLRTVSSGCSSIRLRIAVATS